MSTQSGGTTYSRCVSLLQATVKNAMADVPGILAPFGSDDRIAFRVVRDLLALHKDDLREILDLFAQESGATFSRRATTPLLHTASFSVQICVSDRELDSCDLRELATVKRESAIATVSTLLDTEKLAATFAGLKDGNRRS